MIEATVLKEMREAIILVAQQQETRERQGNRMHTFEIFKNRTAQPFFGTCRRLLARRFHLAFQAFCNIMLNIGNEIP